MFKKRIFVITSALFLALGVATFDQWRWSVGSYPSVADTETDQLGYWLALVDLDSQTVSIRRALVDRLQDELKRGWQPLDVQDAKVGRALDKYQQKITDNIEILTRAWFYYRCEQYGEVSNASRRLEFVRPQVDMVLAWADIYSQVQNNGQAASEKNAFELFDNLDGWIEDAEHDKQDELNLGMHHSVLYWLSTNSIDSLTLETRRELAERIAAALAGGASDKAELLALTAAHQSQLQSNAFSLVEVWLLNRSLEFVKLESNQREPYLDAQLETVKDWGLEKILVNDTESAAGGSQMQLLKLMGNLAIWSERAPAQYRASYKKLTTSLRQYALKKVLQF